MNYGAGAGEVQAEPEASCCGRKNGTGQRKCGHVTGMAPAWSSPTGHTCNL